MDDDHEPESVPNPEELNSDLNPVKNTDIQPSSKLNSINSINGEISNGVKIKPTVSKPDNEVLETFTI